MSDWKWAGTISALVLAVYWWTVAPGVTLVDSGEFVLVCSRLGIGHPPGVPLYVMLGHLFSMLPLGDDLARRTNLFSAVSASATAGMSYLLIRALVPALDRFKAASGAALWGFSLSLWSWAVVTEVYALNILLITIMLWLAACGKWVTGSFVAGLALGVHHATVAMAIPPAAWLAWQVRKPSKWQILAGIGAGLVGLSVYVYLPLRAATHPVLNWGDPATALSVWEHVSGKEYTATVEGAIRGSSLHIVAALGVFLDQWWRQVPLLALWVAMLGMFHTRTNDRTLFLFTCGLVTCNVAGTILLGFGGVDVTGYYLPSFLSLSWCFAIGANDILVAIPCWSGRVMVCVLIITAVVVNFPLNDHHGDVIASKYVENTMHDVPDGSLILTADWNFYAPWLAEHFVAGRYPKVDVIFTGLLIRPWYLEMVKRDYPDLFAAGAVDARADRFIAGMIQYRLLQGRRVFATLRIEKHFLEDVPLQPHGLLREYRGELRDVPLDLSGFDKTPVDDGIMMVRRTYAGMLAENTQALIERNPVAAHRDVSMALHLIPDQPEALRLERALYK